MKVLHITAIGSEVKKSGVPSVLSNLCTEQCNIANTQSRVLSVRTESGKKEDYFDTLNHISFKDYVANYNPDLVIFHTVFFIQYVKIARVLIKMKIPYAIEPHGSFGEMALKKSFLKKKIALNTIFRSFINNSRAFIYTNIAEKNDSIIHNKLEVVIPNGVSEGNLTYELNRFEEKDNLPTFYYLGRYKIHHKGLDYLMKALKILDDNKENICVRFYGMGDKAEMSFMQQWILRYKNIDVKELGTLYDEEKARVLSKANILLLTSRYEGSPITVLDALTFGNPCLVTPGTNVADEIESNGLGWKTDLDEKSISESILKAKSEYLADQKGYYSRCKSYVSNHYLWSKIAEVSVNEYKKILMR